jgi:hypothetical protein
MEDDTRYPNKVGSQWLSVHSSTVAARPSEEKNADAGTGSRIRV